MRVEMPIKPLIWWAVWAQEQRMGQGTWRFQRALEGSRSLPVQLLLDSMILPLFPGKYPEDGPSWLMQNLVPLDSDFGCRVGLNLLIPEGTPCAGASQESARLWEAQRSHGIPWREVLESGSPQSLSVMSHHRNPGLGGDRAGKGPTFPMTGGCFP